MTVTGLFTWLGGGQTGDIAYRHERTSYAATGAMVALFTVVSAAFTALALAATGTRPVLAIVAVTAVVGLLAALTGRALATVRPTGGPDRLGLLTRIAVAVLAGGLVAEMAAIVAFGGSIDRVLDDNAQRSANAAPRVVAASAELDQARADRAALSRSIDAAQADIDTALVTARCEYNPNPECPQTRITGVPGSGPEERTANELLDDARARLAAERGRVDGLEQRITDGEKAVATARSSTVDSADRGLGARWRAMNDYTAHEAGALALRGLILLALVLLAALPLVLRWWRGETSFDRHTAARGVLDRAEWDADTAIAIKRAEMRAEAEHLRTEQQLDATRLAVEADAAIDRERQRTRIIAAIGGIEIGISEPPRHSELPDAGDRKDSPMAHEDSPSHLPVSRAASALPAKVLEQPSGGLELPLIGTVPFTDTAARFIRPLVPSFVANAIDTATHPLRTARHAFEEVEEITFTLRRTRKVTVDAQVSPEFSQLPETAHAQRVAATVVDVDPAQRDPR